MDWKYNFQPHILDRGYDYYCDGAVRSIQKENDVISAVVRGSEDYEVEIAIEDEQITNLYCSCPYAEDGNNCKHEAGVFCS